jgi:serine phosphatase RsbU (regulator of sigma subunit)
MLPSRLELVAVPAHDPPAQIAYVPDRGVWYLAAPVHIDDQDAGYVAIGEFREHSPSGDDWRFIAQTAKADLPAVIQAWEALPLLDRGGTSAPVVAVRWGARLLADAGRRESRLITATQEVALVGDIAALLNGEEDLQHVLDRIVSETARVMQCPYASIRLYNPETKELTIKAACNLSPAYIAKGAVLRIGGSIDDMALGGQVVQIDDMTTDPRVQYPDEARREGIVSLLTAGMIYRGSPVGVLRVYTRRRRRFRKGQRDLLRAVAYQAATAIVHAQIVDERIRAAETQRQLSLAGDLQRRMVRTSPPQRAGVETAIVFRPSYQVSGDFCDVFELRDGRLAVVVGDVVGKGIPASLLMSTVRGAIRAAAEWCTSPGELLTQLNRQVCRETLPREFVTLALVALDTRTLTLTYCSAGHEPLMILRGEGVALAEDGDTVLGINPGVVYGEHALSLQRGDLVLLYTDGAVEARNFAGEQFGRERLRESLITYAPLATQQVLDSILWDVRRYVGLAEQMDDLTLAALRVK